MLAHSQDTLICIRLPHRFRELAKGRRMIRIKLILLADEGSICHRRHLEYIIAVILLVLSGAAFGLRQASSRSRGVALNAVPSYKAKVQGVENAASARFIWVSNDIQVEMLECTSFSCLNTPQLRFDVAIKAIKDPLWGHWIYSALV
ncbi:uncharacterized protein MYCFIDRAFT_177540 [Pseudocercospora fijiensis CIRAD86]|uniref:Uncharacterized protein n=1 Tax=Pseudocercospora fijiensis (strain CIRAD86) TaxID=383855 RepID=M2ZND4_PSEFD|nr:uncharacterized protein MYCFIDRAFT_177540 [Pseudocercospora fijiensis CIRAD86]EME80609.1 hypothetical protein MYCFIDRAFT_177540 [Pseudocercospora fijiensis CIRAD86]